MLSVFFNMHIQLAWGKYLQFTDPTRPPNFPQFFFSFSFRLSSKTFLARRKRSYIHKCTVTPADMLRLFTINTISKIYGKWSKC